MPNIIKKLVTFLRKAPINVVLFLNYFPLSCDYKVSTVDFTTQTYMKWRLYLKKNILNWIQNDFEELQTMINNMPQMKFHTEDVTKQFNEKHQHTVYDKKRKLESMIQYLWMVEKKFGWKAALWVYNIAYDTQANTFPSFTCDDGPMPDRQDKLIVVHVIDVLDPIWGELNDLVEMDEISQHVRIEKLVTIVDPIIKTLCNIVKECYIQYGETSMFFMLHTPLCYEKSYISSNENLREDLRKHAIQYAIDTDCHELLRLVCVDLKISAIRYKHVIPYNCNGIPSFFTEYVDKILKSHSECGVKETMLLFYRNFNNHGGEVQYIWDETINNTTPYVYNNIICEELVKIQTNYGERSMLWLNSVPFCVDNVMPPKYIYKQHHKALVQSRNLLRTIASKHNIPMTSAVFDCVTNISFFEHNIITAKNDHQDFILVLNAIFQQYGLEALMWVYFVGPIADMLENNMYPKLTSKFKHPWINDIIDIWRISSNYEKIVGENKYKITCKNYNHCKIIAYTKADFTLKFTKGKLTCKICRGYSTSNVASFEEYKNSYKKRKRWYDKV